MRNEPRGHARRLPLHIGARSACVSIALSFSGCYAAVGPSVSFVRNGPVALGFEASAASAAFGASYALGNAGERPWRNRTFLAWEPRIGLPTRHLTGGDTVAFGFAGVGGTIGAHWDTVDGATEPAKARFLGGAWLGGGYAFPASNSGCDGAFHPYLSFAAGIRGDELYLTPKVGFVDDPGLCLSIGPGG